MNIQLARTFLEVVKAGSMSLAADRLHVTHSTVTVRIKTLEDILRRQVLVRNRNGVQLTADGTRFLEFAESLVRTWQITRRNMSLASGFESILSIGVERTLWKGVANDWLIKTRSARPEVAIRCEVDANDRLIQRLFEGWLDVCIVFETQVRSGFRAEKLFDDPLILASTQKREAMTDMDPLFVSVDYDTGVRYQTEVIWGEHDATPHLSVSDLEMGLDFVSRYGGSMLIPRRMLDGGDLPCPLHPIAGQPMIERPAYIVYSLEAMKSRRSRIKIDALRESFIRQFEGKEDIWSSPR